MIREIMLLAIFKMSAINAMPLQFPLLQPLPGTLQQQQLALQEQMLAIQQFQALQRFNAMPSPLAMSPQQSLLILFPNAPTNMIKDDRYAQLNENIVTKNKPVKGTADDDSDSIRIDAEPILRPEDSLHDTKAPMRAVLFIPNTGRLSIGGIISNIPFLPIEINVPDSISWIYEGISGIISGIGQSWPFNRPQTSENQNKNTKTIWNDLMMKQIMPIIVMPLGQPMMPMQV